ncbi:hypothetical protein NAB30_00790 [Proteus mirabilis]|uniref:hypothetical protein n=1 Tax=Proteus mirabilis TaxID=584 RepID=UPI0020253511|nr:hypothetical protein [Proteus mirabilis]MCL8600606.1 hypothetical protein [Proteus mirabilis]
MATSKKESKEKVTDSDKVAEQHLIKKKTCFIIMPIADHPDYEKGHFKRVYEYLIKPACETAGYEPIRADDSKASHMIMFDILKKIVECDMAICDLTTKNANVFYELGLRQAFNKKTILITDGKEKAPFDIAGFRYVEYSSTLRVDQVKIDIPKITEMLEKTESDSENSINSIVKLLEMQPAKIEPRDLNSEESMLFKMVMSVNEKIDALSKNKNSNIKKPTYTKYKIDNFHHISLEEIYNKNKDELFDLIFFTDNEKLGKIIEIDDDFIEFTNNGINFSIPNNIKMRKKIWAKELAI